MDFAQKHMCGNDLSGLMTHVAWTLSSMSFVQQGLMRFILSEPRRQEIHAI
jgi:hypothetical protein